MAIKIKLPKEVTDAINAAFVALDNFITEQTEARESKSEKWLESDAAATHEAWIEELTSVADALDNAPLEAI